MSDYVILRLTLKIVNFTKKLILMKHIQPTLKSITSVLFGFFWLFFFSGYTSFAQKSNKIKKNREYSVAAYVWPSCHDEKNE